MSYLWQGTRYSVDIIAGTGLRTHDGDRRRPTRGRCPPTSRSISASRISSTCRYGGPIKLGLDVINVLDEVYLIRSQAGVGVFAPAYGPRRTFFAGVRKEF